KQSEVTAEKLYAQYMEPYPNMVTPMVRGDIPAEKVMSEALMLYDKHAYSESAVLLQQVYNEYPNDQTAFYLAICQLMLQKPREAITLLEARNWKDTAYFSPAVVNWYLVMAFFHLGRSEERRVGKECGYVCLEGD